MSSPEKLAFVTGILLYVSLIVEVCALNLFGRLHSPKSATILRKFEIRTLLLVLLIPMYFVGSGHHKDSGLLWFVLIVIEYGVAVTFLHFRMGLSISGHKSRHDREIQK